MNSRKPDLVLGIYIEYVLFLVYIQLGKYQLLDT